MDTLDARLRGLRAKAIDPRLDSIDIAVMDGLNSLRERRSERSQLMMSAVFALAVGLGASMAQIDNARADSGDGLISAPALAPSQLLGR